MSACAGQRHLGERFLGGRIDRRKILPAFWRGPFALDEELVSSLQVGPERFGGGGVIPSRSGDWPQWICRAFGSARQ